VIYSSDDGMTLTDAAIELGVSRNLLKKRCDRGTIDYFLDEDGKRRIPHEVIEEWGSRTVDDFEGINPYDYDPKFDIPKAEIWGNGKAPVIELPKNKRWITVMGVNDIHAPYHNMRLIDATIEVAESLQPDIFVIGGDTNDFFSLSRFNKASERMDMLQQELDQGKMIRQAYRDAVPNAQMEELIGNHEERLLTYPGFNAPALRSLSALKPSTLLGLDELQIRHWPINGFRLTDDFLVEHGATVRGQAGATAKARLDATLISGVMGHTHRMGEARRTGYRELTWFEAGCLCMLNPDYVRGEANWKNGFWIGQFSTQTGVNHVQLVPAVGQGFIIDGRHYGDTNIELDIFTGPSPNFEQDVPSDYEKVIVRS
jgi:hypothetical protein